MRDIDFPKVEYILSNRYEKLGVDQNLWGELVAVRESIVNTAIKNYVGLSKDKCMDMYLSTFLDSVYASIKPYLNGECVGKLLFDDFTYVASKSWKALVEIINNPNTKLIKVEEYLPFNKVSNTGIKTMQWLAKRPGRSIAEKIAPRNKVLTMSTKFSVDTKENQASMYLYDIVYTILCARLFVCDCGKKQNDSKCSRDCETKKLFDQLFKLYTMNGKYKQSELRNIPKVRHSVQNNKLLYDKNYKLVWDCNVKLSTMEKELEYEWKNLSDILCHDIYYCILAIIKQSTDIKLMDSVGKIEVTTQNKHMTAKEKKNVGMLQFSNADKITFVRRAKDSLTQYTFGYADQIITLATKEYMLKDSSMYVAKSGETKQQYSLQPMIKDILQYINKVIEDTMVKE